MRTSSCLQRFDDIELAVHRVGEGLPFVWGHSLMGSIRSEEAAGLWDWSEVERRADVLRYDARGHGNSDGSYDPGDYRWPHLASDMLAVANTLCSQGAWRRSVLGGISMGAATALEAAVQKPEAVAGLILALPPTAWDTRARQAGIYRRLAWLTGLLGSAPYRLLDLLPIPVREDGRSRLGLHTARGLARANPRHIQAALRGAALSDMPEPEQLAGLKVPTLILAWTDDPAHPLSTAELLADYLPEVDDLVICNPSDLDDWQPAILGFLDRIGKREKRRSPRRRRSKSAGAAA